MINIRELQGRKIGQYDPTYFYVGQRVRIYLERRESEQHLVRQGVVISTQAVRSIEGRPQASGAEKACLELILDWRGRIKDVPTTISHEEPEITENLYQREIERPYHYTNILWAEEVLE